MGVGWRAAAGSGGLTLISSSSQRDRRRDLTLLMLGMLRWIPEQARQMNTPREQEPHPGSAERKVERMNGARSGAEKDKEVKRWRDGVFVLLFLFPGTLSLFLFLTYILQVASKLNVCSHVHVCMRLPCSNKSDCRCEDILEIP